MGLNIISIEVFNKTYQKIVGEIDYLKEKLEGKLPVNSLELIHLINLYGRKENSHFKINGEDIKFYRNKANLDKTYDLSKLDVSEIKDMCNIFSYSNFNGDISNWNTSNVTNMDYMFYEATNFNGNIGNWNTSKVTSMEYMFCRASNFNQILNFDTNNVTNMKKMFSYAIKFNQPLDFNTSNIKNMESMFHGAENFNQKINFNTNKVTDMEGMFAYAKKINQPLNFDTTNVTNMSCMFSNATNFNQALIFNTSNVTNMAFMFSCTTNFNQALNFDISNVIDMENMFDEALAFENKYNSGKPLPNKIEDIKDWLIENRERMNMIDTKNIHGKEIDDFFSNFTDIYSTNRIGLHNNIHSLPISIP